MTQSLQILFFGEVHVLQLLELVFCICKLTQPVKSFSRAPSILSLLQGVSRLDCQSQLRDQRMCGSNIDTVLHGCTHGRLRCIALESLPAAQKSAALLQLPHLPFAALPNLPMLAD